MIWSELDDDEPARREGKGGWVAMMAVFIRSSVLSSEFRPSRFLYFNYQLKCAAMVAASWLYMGCRRKGERVSKESTQGDRLV